jgi:hypothetical protein
MGRRDSFDDGHGMDHHKIRNAMWVGIGAINGAQYFGGPVGALAGAAIAHGVNKHYDKRRENREEEDYF